MNALPGPLCCYCGERIPMQEESRVVKGRGTYIGWRHDDCTEVTNHAHWITKVDEADRFVAALKTKARV